MARYLLVAHQPADSLELRSRVLDLVREGKAAEFVLLVPAAPIVFLPAAGGEGRTAVQMARWRGARARTMLEEAGARVAAVRIGSYDPFVAVEEELPGSNYDAGVISTLPPALSRWRRLTLPSKVPRRFPQVRLIQVTAQPLPASTG